jgi:hypothetical protein
MLDQSGVDGLPIDTLMSYKVAIFKIIQKAQKGHIECEYCKEKLKATMHCADCRKFTCERCSVDLHNIVVDLQGHTLTRVNRLAVSYFLSNPLTCALHRKPMIYYCKECLVVSCPGCIGEKHLGHACISVNGVGGKTRRALQKSLMPLIRIRESIQSSKKEVAGAQQKLNAKNQLIQKEIDKAFTKIEIALKGRRKELFDELRHTSNIKEERLRGRMLDLEAEEITISSSIDRFQSALENYSWDEPVSTSKVYDDYVVRKSSHHNSSVTTPLLSSYSYIDRNLSKDISNVENSISSFGCIGASASPKYSVISNLLDKELIAGKMHTFMLEARSYEGQCCDKGGETVTVRLRLRDSKNNIEGTSRDKKNGFYDLSFTAPSSGSYLIDVFINSRPIKDSPFQVRIRARPSLNYESNPKVTPLCEVKDEPRDLCLLPDNTLYLLCSRSIYKFSTDGALLGQITGVDANTRFKESNWGMATVDNILYVTNDGEKKVIKLRADGKQVDKGFGEATRSSKIAIDKTGQIYVTLNTTDKFGPRCTIAVYTRNEIYSRSINCSAYMWGITAVDPSSVHLAGDGFVKLYSHYKEVRRYGKEVKGRGLLIDEDDYSLVADAKPKGRLMIFDRAGNEVKAVEVGSYCAGVAMDNSSFIYIASALDKQLYKLEFIFKF